MTTTMPKFKTVPITEEERKYIDSMVPQYSDKDFYKIISVKNFETITGIKIKDGDEGGFIQSIMNLSARGKSWISKGSIVCDTSRVEDNAFVDKNCIICDNCTISGYAIITSGLNDNVSILSGSLNINA